MHSIRVALVRIRKSILNRRFRDIKLQLRSVHTHQSRDGSVLVTENIHRLNSDRVIYTHQFSIRIRSVGVPSVAEPSNFVFLATIFYVSADVICLGKMDDECVIECVQQYGVLYDLENAKYTDTFYTNEIWNKIAEQIGIGHAPTFPE